MKFLFSFVDCYRYSQLKSESSSKTNELEQINKNLSEKNEYIERFQKVWVYLFGVIHLVRTQNFSKN